MESVEPESDSGLEMVAVKSEPVLPTRRPVRVVEPVPPFATPRVPPKLERDAQVPFIA